MSPRTWTVRPKPIGVRLIAASVLGLTLAVLILRVNLAGQASPDALPFAKNYLLTGNYVVGGIDLQPNPANRGSVSGNISIGGVPANADILAAFLYWETYS